MEVILLYKIAASIILYNPDIERLKENLNAIYKQVGLIVLVDNCSNNIKEIEKEINIYKNTIIIKNNSNKGIAAALNQAIHICEERKYDWVLTLDQDSVCPLNIVEEYSKYIDIDNIGIICPTIIDRNIKNHKKTKNNKTFEYVKECITSASLTNIRIWNLVGKFDEDMFIDIVDFDFCKRILLNEYKIIRINNIELLHEVGSIVQRKFLLKTVNVMNHSPNRKYYMSRNVLYYGRKYNDKKSILKAYLSIIKLTLIVLLYESQKLKKTSSIIKGLIDGITMDVQTYNLSNDVKEEVVD